MPELMNALHGFEGDLRRAGGVLLVLEAASDGGFHEPQLAVQWSLPVGRCD